uniref:Annexin n=1 Tax=Mesocestoides corti TaxID=53468 RepID=A0A5K3FAU9_MESCO
MPLAGGIPAPTITPLRLNTSGKSLTTIDTGTFVELAVDSPNCSIYFTTNGETPNPSHRIFAGREVTYKYRAPFQLKSGRRIIKAIAVHRVTKAESHIVSKTFTVTDLSRSSSSDSIAGEEYSTSIVPAHNNIHSTMDDPIDSFLKKNTDQGFAATNHSGTQINVYGSVPGVGWDMKTPDGNNFSSNFLPPMQQPIYSSPL